MKHKILLAIFILLLSFSLGFSSFNANIVTATGGNFTETDTLQTVTDRGAKTNNFFSLVDENDIPMISLETIISGGDRSGKLTISSNRSTYYDSALYVAQDSVNSGAESLYIHGGPNQRIFIGDSSHNAYSVDLRYVQRIQGIPAEISMLSGNTYEGGSSSSIVSGGGYRLVLYSGSYTGSLSGANRAVGGMGSIPWISFVSDDDAYFRPAAYIYRTVETSSGWSNDHTRWTIGNSETNNLIRLTMDGTLVQTPKQSTSEGLIITMPSTSEANGLRIDKGSGNTNAYITANGSSYFADDMFVNATIYAENFVTLSKVADFSSESRSLDKLNNIDTWKSEDGRINYDRHYSHSVNTVRVQTGTKQIERFENNCDDKGECVTEKIIDYEPIFTDKVIDGLDSETRVAEMEKMIWELHQETQRLQAEINTLKGVRT